MSEVVVENRVALVVALAFITVGFLVGMIPQVATAILESTPTMDNNFDNVLTTTIAIAQNNIYIAFLAFIGGFILFPTLYFAVYSVGRVFGALAVNMEPLGYLSAILTFGALELIGMILSIAGGLLFFSYLGRKIVGRSADLEDTLKTAGVLFLYSLAFLIVAAILESFLLYAATVQISLFVPVILGGTATSLILIYWLLIRPR